MADIVADLRSSEHRQPVNPKAVYRTRDVALFEDAAAEIERLRAMIDHRNEFIADRGLWAELSEYLAKPTST